MKSVVSLEGIKKAVFYPFQGEKWGIKLLIGTALTFGAFIIPLLPLVPVFGYFGRVMRLIIVDNQDPQLPKWNDWGELLLGGLKLFGAIIIYLLPALILTVGGYGLFMLLDFSLVLTSNAAPASAYNIFPFPIILSAFGMFAGIAVMLLGFMLALLTIIFLPPALGNLIAKDDFVAAFRIREWWPVLRVNLGGFIISLAITIGLFYLLYTLSLVFYATIVLCFLLPIVFAFISFLCIMLGLGLFAIAYRDGLQKIEANA